jgi:hypothetical protein
LSAQYPRPPRSGGLDESDHFSAKTIVFRFDDMEDEGGGGGGIEGIAAILQNPHSGGARQRVR